MIQNYGVECIVVNQSEGETRFFSQQNQSKANKQVKKNEEQEETTPHHL